MCVVTDCTVMLSSGLTHVYICPWRKVQFLPPPARTAIGLHDYERGTLPRRRPLSAYQVRSLDLGDLAQWSAQPTCYSTQHAAACVINSDTDHQPSAHASSMPG